MLHFNGPCGIASLQVLMKMRNEGIKLTRTQILEYITRKSGRCNGKRSY